MNLYDIQDPSFLKDLSIDELNLLAQDIRDFLIHHVSKTGGHLSSNLGIVELTMALHYSFDSPKDKIFFDVGHQSYVHKILTGRARSFDTLRQFNGMSGFQKRKESIHDVWEAGHSSTALSAAVGMAFARDLNHEDYAIIPVIGDAAMVGGESLEALNHLGSTSSKVIIVLNDNQMSISKNVGAIDQFLAHLRINVNYNKAKHEYKAFLNQSKYGKWLYDFSRNVKNYIKNQVVQDTIFTEFGVDYLGPIDGHDFRDLFRAFEKAKDIPGSVVVHVLTKKGKGYPYAEHDQTGKWHGVAPFDIVTGKMLTSYQEGEISWSECISHHLLQLMKQDQDIVAITPAMIEGSKMRELFNVYPERCFDVGIAEEHAMTFVTGLSVSKKKPFVSIYSSFLQRAYDQINHDLARINTFAFVSIDRCGLVGEDGETHHGVFDISFLSAIPNIVIGCPSCAKEAKMYMNTAFKKADRPYFMRISRSSIFDDETSVHEYIEIGSWTILQTCNKPQLIIISYGEKLSQIKKMYDQQDIIIVNARFIKPLDEAMLNMLATYHCPILVYETNLIYGGLNSLILLYYQSQGIDVAIHVLGIQDHFSPQGKIAELEQFEKIDLKALDNKVKELING